MSRYNDQILHRDFVRALHNAKTQGYRYAEVSAELDTIQEKLRDQIRHVCSQRSKMVDTQRETALTLLRALTDANKDSDIYRFAVDFLDAAEADLAAETADKTGDLPFD